MLLKEFRITHTLPCLADPEKISAIVSLSDDIHEVLPYLNATVKGTIYHHQAWILTLKKDGVPSCLAFAVKIVSEEFNVMQCAPVFTPEHRETRGVLLKMLYAAGLTAPEAFRK